MLGCSGRSALYTEYKREASILPCGIPAWVGNTEEKEVPLGDQEIAITKIWSKDKVVSRYVTTI